MCYAYSMENQKSMSYTDHNFFTLKSGAGDGSMEVAFYPVKTPGCGISNQWSLKVTFLKGNKVAQRMFSFKEMNEQVAGYIKHNYAVTQVNNSLPQIANPMMGAC